MSSMDMPPPFQWGNLFTQWSFSWMISAVLLAALLLYLAGVRRFNQEHDTSWSRKRTVSFLGALVIIVLATQSVIGVYDMTLFTDHMVQHLLLIMVAAGVLAMSAPLELCQESLAGKAGRGVNKIVDSKVGGVIGHPLFGLLIYGILIPITHLTGLFNLMLEHMWIHYSEEAIYLAAGYLFWRPVVAIEPTRHPLSPGLRIVYLFLAVPVDSFTGLALVMSNHEMFSTYQNSMRTWGPSLLTDLHTGGALMWIGGDLLMMLTIIPIFLLWTRDEDSKVDDLDARLDAERAAAGLPFSVRDTEYS